jgi:hypothetical protein
VARAAPEPASARCLRPSSEPPSILALHHPPPARAPAAPIAPLPPIPPPLRSHTPPTPPGPPQGRHPLAQPPLCLPHRARQLLPRPCVSARPAGRCRARRGSRGHPPAHRGRGAVRGRRARPRRGGSGSTCARRGAGVNGGLAARLAAGPQRLTRAEAFAREARPHRPRPLTFPGPASAQGRRPLAAVYRGARRGRRRRRCAGRRRRRAGRRGAGPGRG